MTAIGKGQRRTLDEWVELKVRVEFQCCWRTHLLSCLVVKVRNFLSVFFLKWYRYDAVCTRVAVFLCTQWQTECVHADDKVNSQCQRSLLNRSTWRVLFAGVFRSSRSFISWWTRRRTSWWWVLTVLNRICLSGKREKRVFFWEGGWPRISVTGVFPSSQGGNRCYQGICSWWCQIFRAEEYTTGGEKDRWRCQHGASYFDQMISLTFVVDLFFG